MSEMMIEDEEKHADYWDDDQRRSPLRPAQDEHDEGFVRSPAQDLIELPVPQATPERLPRFKSVDFDVSDSDDAGEQGASEQPVVEAAEQPAHVPAPLQQARGGLSEALRQRKQEAARARGPELEAPAAKELGKAGSRSALLDKMIGVGDWLGKGVGMVKEAHDTAGLYGKDIPDVIEAAGGSDSLMEAYAPVQERVQRLGKITEAANKAINPLPKVSLGKIGEEEIKLGVGTKEVLGLATGVAKIAQYHKNEGADPLATAGSERAAFEGVQSQFRRDLDKGQRLNRLIGLNGVNPNEGWDPTSVEGAVHSTLEAERSKATQSSWKNAARMVLRAGELGKAQEKKGIRPLNEYSMEKTAYLNDREFVPQKPLGFFEKEGADAFAPTKGMVDAETGRLKDEYNTGRATESAFSRFADRGAIEGQPLPEGLMPGMREREDLAALPDGYRDDIEGGRSKQKQVAPFRFAKRAGELAEGTLNSDRMVRDGRYGAAYAAKVADTALTSGTKSAAHAAQAGLVLGTGGVAAPLIAAAEAGKTLAIHGKEQLGLGLQWSSEKAEGLIDPKGLAKEQDNRDLYNKHFGLDRPEPAVDDAVAEPVAEQAAVAEPAAEDQASASSAAPMQMSEVDGQLSVIPEEDEAAESDASGEPEPAVEQAEPEAAELEARAAVDPLADPTARAQDIRTRGIHWEKQGDRAVVGRRRRTWGRAIKDATWGGVKKVGKGLVEGVAALATLPYHAAKWGWKGLKGVGSLVKGIGSLFNRKKKDTANPARNALKRLQADAKLGDLDRPQFDWSSISQDDINRMPKDEQQQLRLQREKYDEVFGNRARAGGPRVGGTRKVLQDALMAKPEVKRAEDTAALREQLAPGPNTPRMASGEILELLRGRAREEVAAAQEQPAGGGPGGGGPGGGPGAGPDGGDLLDQIAELEAQEGGNPPAPRQRQRATPSDENQPVSLPAVEDDLAGDVAGGGSRETVMRRLTQTRPETVMYMVPGEDERGGDLDRRDIVAQPGRMSSSQAPEQAHGLASDEEEKQPGDRAHFEMFGRPQGFESDDAFEGPAATQVLPPASVPYAAGRPLEPASGAGAEMLDTSAGGVGRRDMLMDPRELALLTNAADPARAARQLPAIQEAVTKAQSADTKDAATSAWREVDALQRKVVNRRWSQNAASSAAGIAAAGARQAQRDDLLGRAPLIDVSTRHEGLDLPEAQVEDRRLEAGGEDQSRLPDFAMPGDTFNINDHADDHHDYMSRILANPADFFPHGVQQRGEEEMRRVGLKAYRTDPARRRQLQQRDRELLAQQYPDDVMEHKRPLFGDPKANGEYDSLPTDDARAHRGPITVDDRAVEPEFPHRMPKKPSPDDVRYGAYGAHKPFGGMWRDAQTQQPVQFARTEGAQGLNRYQESGSNPIPEDRRVDMPAAGWDQLKKPGWFAGKAAKEAYRQQKAAAQATVKQAYTKMGRDQQPSFVAGSKFGKKEWERLEQDRRRREHFLRMKLGQW